MSTGRTLVVDERFNGPPGVVNGGYACAVVAAPLDGLAETTLRRPVPVGTPLVLSNEDGRANLRTESGEDLAEAVTLEHLEAAVPDRVTVTDATAAMERYPGHEWGELMFPCFVCGPNRPDTLGVFPGPVTGRDVVAAVWEPGPDLAAADGLVPDEFSWSVLDCTGSWAAIISNELRTGALLGRMASEIVRQPQAGQSYVVVGRAGQAEGRKLPAVATLFTADGDLVARARLLCIAPRTD